MQLLFVAFYINKALSPCLFLVGMREWMRYPAPRFILPYCRGVISPLGGTVHPQDNTVWVCLLVFLVCLSQYIYCSICILVLCKIMKWATWADNSIPMMHHAAWYSTSFSRLAWWNGGPLPTVTVNVYPASAQFIRQCNRAQFIFKRFKYFGVLEITYFYFATHKQP